MIRKKSAVISMLCGVSLSVLTMSAHAVVLDDDATVSTQSKAVITNQANPAFADQLIIKYKSNVSQARGLAARNAVERAASKAMGVELRHVRKLATGAHVLAMSKQRGKLRNKKAMTSMLAELRADPNVEYVQVDRMLKPMATPNDPRYIDQWHYYEATGGVNMPAAWDISTGSGVVVAILDTGITSHPDLNANVLPGYDMISSPDIGNDGNGRDSNPADTGDATVAGECGPNSPPRNQDSSWHGTHVAGTVAAVGNNNAGVTGVAYDAQLLPVRVLGKCGGRTSDIADAMIWAAGGSVPGVPNNPNPAKVINLSLGGGGSCDATSQAAINRAVSLGAAVVVAAGNSAENAINATPANCQNVITVAATGRTGGRASYSNFGNVVDFAAPGGDQRTGRSDGVLSTLNNGRNGPSQPSFEYYQGTSMATPHVAGIAALMYSVNPSLTPTQIENTLAGTARAFPNSCSGCGAGLVDAAAAVAAVNPNPTQPSVTRFDIERGTQVDGLSAPRGGEIRTEITIPAGATNLRFLTGNGTGDADLYVRLGSEPTTTTFDCSSTRTNNNAETCEFDLSPGGTYHVLFFADQAVNNLSTLIVYDDPTPQAAAEELFSANNIGWRSGTRSGTFNVPAGITRLVVQMSGGTGDANLGVRPNGNANFSCTSTNAGTNNESCVVNNPRAGTWQVSVSAASRFSRANLIISGER